ncbi:uncharacterized protein LOC119669760 [Teleopsis dalmanni]|uniref:uncharacterized protein LOC119669760 n=1 Tax=Teleopsis dalmanni TaxID=139649 RepID=UPI0018CF9D35|nr:uncharacterized protein LOC119669760 [Teleopsis dalmanni]
MSSKNKTTKTNKKSKSRSSKQNSFKCKSDNAYLPSASATKPSLPNADQGKKPVSQKPLKKILKTKKQTLLLRESCGYITVTPVGKSSKRKKKTTSHKTVTFNEDVDINIIPNDKSVSSETECDPQPAKNSEKQQNKSEDDSTEMVEIGDQKTLIDILKGNPNHISIARLSKMKWRISGNSTLQTTEKDDPPSTLDMTRLRSGFQSSESKDLMESEKEERAGNDIKTEQLNVAENIFRKNLDCSPKYRYADLTPMEKEYLVPFKIPQGYHSEFKQKGTEHVIKKKEEKSVVVRNRIRSQERKLPEKIVKDIQQEPQQTSCESPVKGVIKNVDKGVDIAKGVGAELTKGVIRGISVGAGENDIENVTKGPIKIAIRGVIKGDVGRVVGGAIEGVVGSAVEGDIGCALRGALGGAVGGTIKGAVDGVVEGAIGGAVGAVVEGAIGGDVEAVVEGAIGGDVGAVVEGAIGGTTDGITENIVEGIPKDKTSCASKGSAKNIAGGASNVKIFSDSIIDDPLIKARNDLLDILIMHEGLSKEYDVNFAKLRYVQLLCKEPHDACHDPLIKKILNVYELIDCQDKSDSENLSEEEDT